MKFRLIDLCWVMFSEIQDDSNLHPYLLAFFFPSSLKLYGHYLSNLYFPYFIFMDIWYKVCVCLFLFIKSKFISIKITMRKLASKWGKKRLLINSHYCPSRVETGKFCGYIWIALTPSLCRKVCENVSDLMRHLIAETCTLFIGLEAKLKKW